MAPGIECPEITKLSKVSMKGHLFTCEVRPKFEFSFFFKFISWILKPCCLSATKLHAKNGSHLSLSMVLQL